MGKGDESRHFDDEPDQTDYAAGFAGVGLGSTACQSATGSGEGVALAVPWVLECLWVWE